jgi:hypothetical protein
VPAPAPAHRPGIALRAAFLAFPLLASFGGRAAAQTFTLGTPSVPARLSVTTAVAGQPPTSATLAAGTWTGQTSGGGGSHKISARIVGGSVPPGVTVTIVITSSGGNVPGVRTLSGNSVDLVTGLVKSTVYSGTVTYGISATSAAGTVAPSTLDVQFTID